MPQALYQSLLTVLGFSFHSILSSEDFLLSNTVSNIFKRKFITHYPVYPSALNKNFLGHFISQLYEKLVFCFF